MRQAEAGPWWHASVCRWLAVPTTQLAKSGVRTRFHLGADRVVEAEQFWPHIASLRTCGALPCGASPAEYLGDKGDADTQGLRDLADRVCRVGGMRSAKPPVPAAECANYIRQCGYLQAG